jgi:hypothetical protein
MDFPVKFCQLHSYLHMYLDTYVVSFLSRMHTLYRQYILGCFIKYVMLTPSIKKNNNAYSSGFNTMVCGA